jgi:hypothetical protein
MRVHAKEWMAVFIAQFTAYCSTPQLASTYDRRPAHIDSPAPPRGVIPMQAVLNIAADPQHRVRFNSGSENVPRLWLCTCLLFRIEQETKTYAMILPFSLCFLCLTRKRL